MDEAEKETVTANLNKLKEQLAQAKEASGGKIAGGLQYQNSLVAKATASQPTSAAKTSPTTGRSCEITTRKITLIPSPKAMALDNPVK